MVVDERHQADIGTEQAGGQARQPIHRRVRGVAEAGEGNRLSGRSSSSSPSRPVTARPVTARPVTARPVTARPVAASWLIGRGRSSASSLERDRQAVPHLIDRDGPDEVGELALVEVGAGLGVDLVANPVITEAGGGVGERECGRVALRVQRGLMPRAEAEQASRRFPCSERIGAVHVDAERGLVDERGPQFHEFVQHRIDLRGDVCVERRDLLVEVGGRLGEGESFGHGDTVASRLRSCRTSRGMGRRSFRGITQRQSRRRSGSATARTVRAGNRCATRRLCRGRLPPPTSPIRQTREPG